MTRYAALILVALFACEHEKSHAPAATLQDPLTFLPADSSVVIGINVAQLRSSPLWEVVDERIHGSASQTQKCDEARSTDLVVVGGKAPDEQVHAVAVFTGADASRAVSCVFSGRERILGNAFSIQAVSATTTVMQIGSGSAAPLQVPESPLRGSPELMNVFNQLSRTDALWFIFDLRAPDFAQPRVRAMNVLYAYGDVTVSDRVVVAAHMSFATAEDASKLVAFWEKDFAAARAQFERLDISAHDKIVDVNLSLTLPQVEAIAAARGLSLHR